MKELINAELASVVNDWKAGRTVRSIIIGHPVRVANGAEVRHDFRQKKAHDCVFAIIDVGIHGGVVDDFEGFHVFATEVAREHGLTAEEQGAAISLAWVALRRGWKSALVGFQEHHAISLNREAEA
jgi:hypothetical protein